jgi:hypothetical protein
MANQIERWDLHKLPPNILISWEVEKNLERDTMVLTGKVYRVGYAKLGSAREYGEKVNEVTYDYLNDNIMGPVGALAEIRGHQANELSLAEIGGAGGDDHVLVPRQDWDNLWARVNKAERWATRWKRLARKLWTGLRRVRNEQFNCAKCGDCDRLGSILDRYTVDQPTNLDKEKNGREA